MNEFEIIDGVLKKYTGNGGEAVIPDGVTEIGEYAFANCAGLTGVRIPDSVTGIGNWAFLRCTGLTEVTLPDSITWLGGCVFQGCSGLKTVRLSSGVQHITCELQGCSGLTELNVPDGVTVIDVAAFLDCSALKTVSIPKSVKMIEYLAFQNCSNLTDLYYAGTAEEWEAVSVGDENGPLLNANRHFRN